MAVGIILVLSNPPVSFSLSYFTPLAISNDGS